MDSTKENPQTISHKRTPSRRSALRRVSSDSVEIVFLDKQAAIDELKERAERLIRQDQRVVAAGLFGSLARGNATAFSDADVLIVLRSHPDSPWFRRIPEYQEAFVDTSLSVEPFPYVLDEIHNMLKQVGLMRTAVRELIPLAGDIGILQQLKKRISQTDERESSGTV